MNRESMWLIWSPEHHAWWRAGRSGYCRELLGAGIYTQAEANEIVHQAGPGKARLANFAAEVEQLAACNSKSSVVGLLASLLIVPSDPKRLATAAVSSAIGVALIGLGAALGATAGEVKGVS